MVGDECWAHLESRTNVPPDLAVLDVMMPGLDGVSVLERIRNHEALVDLRVVMSTSLNERKVSSKPSMPVLRIPWQGPPRKPNSTVVMRRCSTNSEHGYAVLRPPWNTRSLIDFRAASDTQGVSCKPHGNSADCSKL